MTFSHEYDAGICTTHYSCFMKSNLMPKA